MTMHCPTCTCDPPVADSGPYGHLRRSSIGTARLSPHQRGILESLGSGPATAADLGRAVGMNAARAARALRSMADRGLVVREAREGPDLWRLR